MQPTSSFASKCQLGGKNSEWKKPRAGKVGLGEKGVWKTQVSE